MKTHKFINQANKVHSNKYSYVKSIVLNNHTKIEIICPIHGLFFQTPHSHLYNKSGCPNKECIALKIQKTWADKTTEELDDIISRKKSTNQIKYGGNAPACSVEIQKKIAATKFDRYGDEFYVNNTQREKTNLERYGYTQIFDIPSIQQKITESHKNRYGRIRHTQRDIPVEVLQKLNDVDWLSRKHHEEKNTISDIAIELQVLPDLVTKYMRNQNITVINYYRSKGESELSIFLDELKVDYIIRDKTQIAPYELDIYIPEYKIAIEYNGLYWHSEIHKHRQYHNKKTNMCNDAGIRLLHIFEDEWRDMNKQCKDTIRHLLGKSPKGVYARKTKIREISWKRAKDFLNEYHLLGAGTAGNYRIGAFDCNNNLIGVMVFGQQNNEGSSGIELKRFVTNKKNNPGLGSKMFAFAVKSKDYKEVVAFVDRRWFTGLVKEFIGFELISETPPALWWTNGHHRFHRRFETKRTLIADGADSSLTKREMLANKGFYRIYDCGKHKLRWRSHA